MAWLLAAVLALTCLTAFGEAVPPETGKTVEETATETGDGNGTENAGETRVRHVPTEEEKELLRKRIAEIREFFSREEVRSIFSYKDVQELTVDVFGKVLDFLMEDQGTTRKILVAVDAPDWVVDAAVDALWKLKAMIREFNAFMETEEGREVRELYQALMESDAARIAAEDLEKICNSPALKDLDEALQQVLDCLENSTPVSGAMMKVLAALREIVGNTALAEFLSSPEVEQLFHEFGEYVSYNASRLFVQELDEFLEGELLTGMLSAVQDEYVGQ